MGRREFGRRRQKHRHGGDRRAPRGGDNLIMGRNCLREVLRHATERLGKVLVAEARGDAPADRQELIDEIRSAGIKIEFREPDDLTHLVGSD